MNPEDFSRDDLISAAWPVLLLGGLLAVVLWWATVRTRRRLDNGRWLVRGAGVLLASAGFWFAFQLLAKFCSLATSWSLYFLAVIGGLAVEIILWLYGFERSIVSRPRKRLLLALRLLALITLLTILVQPVHSFLQDREIDREIAVLIDESDSMQLSDQRLSASEVLDRAQLFGMPTAGKRPPIHEVEKLARKLRDGMQLEINALSEAPSPSAGLEARGQQLEAFFEESGKENAALSAALTLVLKNSSSLPGAVKNRLNEYLKRSRDGLGRILPLAKKAADSGDGQETLKQFHVAATELDEIFQTLPVVSQRSDEGFLNLLPQNERDALNKAGARPRIDVARQALGGPLPLPSGEDSQEGQVPDLTLLDRLKESYNLRLYRFARDVEEITKLDQVKQSPIGTVPEKTRTDLTAALEHVLENTAPESLAGILLLSDGRHNAGNLPEDSLHQLAVQNSPLSAVPIGGHLGPIDISLLSLDAPESIYLDDRVVIKATAKLDGLLGKKVKAELLNEGKVIDEQVIDVSDVNYRTEIRFVHTPKERGILNYQVRLEPDAREIFKDNNSWDFKVAVTDDRTNVLLVDSYPRWEFRYLRNLFYGRDKSVHLQYVLLNPDKIDRATPPSPVSASVTRKFGDAEATRLPATPEEWELFDVIILGDISPTAISFSEWKAIQEAVTQRGAMLVCIAGQRYMPHAYHNKILTNLLPIQYTPTGDAPFFSPEPSYHIELTSVGRGHPVTSQSSSRSLNSEIWAGFPSMSWRYVSDGVKKGAEILAYARPSGTSEESGVNQIGDGSPGSVEAAIQQLANRKETEAKNALICTIRVGLGKVLMMNFDQTWRFRFGVGDTYHHRFWGQVTRWGAGENLRAGNQQVRVGSDRLAYTPGEPIAITAKVLDDSRHPVTSARVYASLYRGDKRVLRQKMSYQKNSSGIYKTSVLGLTEEGEYTVRLEGSEVEKGIANYPDGPSEIATELVVMNSRNPVELAELTADRDFLNRATRMTNGKVAELWNLESLLDVFGSPKEILKERRNISLWDTWQLLVLFLAILTIEWVVRRRSGLV